MAGARCGGGEGETPGVLAEWRGAFEVEIRTVE
jgi:hypothetical protein